MLEARSASFARDVLEASRQVPVLVDFWAPWCGPCRALGPVLEKLELAYEGRFRLVKVNSDQEPDLAAQFNVRSIPFVVAFVDGAPVSSFVGAQPEAQIRRFIDTLLPDPAGLEHRKAQALLAAGDVAGAATALRAAVALDPGRIEAQMDLADLLIHRLPPGAGTATADEARAALAAVRAREPGHARLQGLQAALDATARAAALPDRTALDARVQAAPDDLQARLDLANRLIAERDLDAALPHLLEIVRRDRAFGDDIGRKTVLGLFALAADRPAWVAGWRRQLSAALNR